LIPLNNYEVKILTYIFKNAKDRGVTAVELARSTELGLYKVRRTLESLEKKALLTGQERSKTKPYFLSEHGEVFGWLASMRNKQLVELYRHQTTG
jgi:DNA-binding IclR family transcriptional regulator